MGYVWVMYGLCVRMFRVCSARYMCGWVCSGRCICEQVCRGKSPVPMTGNPTQYKCHFLNGSKQNPYNIIIKASSHNDRHTSDMGE